MSFKFSTKQEYRIISIYDNAIDHDKSDWAEYGKTLDAKYLALTGIPTIWVFRPATYSELAEYAEKIDASSIKKLVDTCLIRVENLEIDGVSIIKPDIESISHPELVDNLAMMVNMFSHSPLVIGEQIDSPR